MASLPQQPGSQRHRSLSNGLGTAAPLSHSQGSAAHVPTPAGEASIPRTAQNSQEPLENNRPSTSSDPSPAAAEPQPSQHNTTPTMPPFAAEGRSTPEPRRCWICFADETEDTPLSSEWRSPCPCALTAHEACLLDWIADLESPTNMRKRTNAGPEICCPQCKSEIVVVRPRSAVVELVNRVERATGKLVIPGVITVFAGCLFTGCLVYGFNTIYIIFGPEDAAKIVSSGVEPASWGSILFRILDTIIHPLTTPEQVSKWKLYVGLPLIPILLILSRTNLADSVLPILPVVFFATQAITEGTDRSNLGNSWHPSPTLAFATLPYLRGAYNEFFERVFGNRLRAWNKELQPRAGENMERDGQEADGQRVHNQLDEQDEEDEGEVLLEVNVDIDLLEEDGDDDGDDNDNDVEDDVEEIEDPNQDHQLANPVPLPAAAAAAAAAAGQAQPPVLPAPAARVNNLVISIGQLADTTLGALIFPEIASEMGSLLQLVLPRSWTTPPGTWERRTPGLLQTKWGRTLVGGCLFVVLKDAVVLYARWKQAQTHRHRKVLDYDRASRAGQRL